MVTRTTTWDGYIGLMYASDYGYAVGSGQNACLGKSMVSYSSDNCGANDWLTPSIIAWTITPAPYSSSSRCAFFIRSSGAVNFSSAYFVHEVLPVVYLKSNTKIIPNSRLDKIYGSVDNPFVLQ